jgi:hypothetical protein
MRSKLVFGAMAYVSNRYLLTRLARRQPANSTDQILAYRKRRMMCWHVLVAPAQ